jgi:hypothetical protein
MLKRVFWLALAAAIGWLLWRLWQRRQEDFAVTTPYLAPLEPVVRPVPPDAPEQARAQEATPAPAPRRDAATAVPDEQAATTAAERAAEADSSALGEIMGYCPRCKAKRLINEAHEETTESGRRAARGACPVCGGNMFTFLPNKVSG